LGFGKYVEPGEERVEWQEEEDLDRDMVEEDEGVASMAREGREGMVS